VKQRPALPLVLVWSLVCLAGIIVSLSEPAAFLDEQAALLILRLTPTQNHAQVCKVVMPRETSSIQLAQMIAQLKSTGVAAILVTMSPNGLEAEAALGNALAMEGVVWVANPAAIDPALARRATCRPLLVCAEFGSAVIAESGTNQLRSATALALTCSGDVQSFKRLRSRPFKLLFRRQPYQGPGNTNIALACIAPDETGDPRKCRTPAGLKARSDYALDICQALLDRRWLIEPPESVRCALAGLATLIFLWFGNGVRLFMILAALVAVLCAVAWLGKILLPVVPVIMLWLFVLAVRPLLFPSRARESIAS
jgi:hypothetical protein